MITREQVTKLALQMHDSMADQCATLNMPLPESFENQFYEELEELLVKFYGDPDYGNYN